MNKVFIVDIHKNLSLLRFTETKVFFNAKNEGTDWAYDCIAVDSVDEISDNKGIIINSGEFVSTKFRNKFINVDTLIDARGHPDLIQFTADYEYDIRKPPPYAASSKQKYIIENLYKVIIRSKKLVYLDNTEKYITPDATPEHFYGLASGWKSVQYVKDFGISSLKSITVYDLCQRQLDYQKMLLSLPELPDSLDISAPAYGEYDPSDELKEFWPQWHNTAVNFILLDLYTAPVFPDNSFVWVSNAFKYEPNIFKYGWQHCKMAKENLILNNKSSKIIDI